MFQEMQQTWSDAERQNYQAWRFDGLVARLRRDNPLFRERWKDISPLRLRYDHLEELPFTLKADLLEDQRRHPPFGTNLTFPLSQYVRFHQTSGTSGTPLRVLDTARDWSWWAACWKAILDAAEVTRDDRVMLAFSFGPFIGFWSAHEALQQYGALVLTGGGMNSAQRLAMMRDLEATVLICTPSYALHLAEVARQEGMDPARDLKIRITIHAGEPGAGIPATRRRIETLWGSRTYDHPGASEVGAFGFSCSAQRGVHVNEAEFICEVLDPATGRPVEAGTPGELVLTNLGRDGFPVVRYRTGDIVKPLPRHTCSCGRTWLLLEGGILGRRDDMVTIRGVNVFPSAFQAIFNGVPEIGEHRITAYRVSHMDQLHVEYEDLGGKDRREELLRLIREKLGIRVTLQPCDPGTLPRSETKARRFLDRRLEDWLPEGGKVH
jgi:phenylacetate-CoA ligase